MTTDQLLAHSHSVPQCLIDAFRASHHAAVAPSIRHLQTWRLLSGIQAQFDKADHGVPEALHLPPRQLITA